MPANIFISYDHDDYSKKNGFLAIKNNPNHPLVFHDHSLKNPVLDKAGNVIRVPPSDPRSAPVREEIQRKFENASRLVVLIGADTHKSEWVKWEIETFYKMKERVDGQSAWKRIRGMFLKDREGAYLPPSLIERSAKVFKWDPEALDAWIKQDL